MEVRDAMFIICVAITGTVVFCFICYNFIRYCQYRRRLCRSGYVEIRDRSLRSGTARAAEFLRSFTSDDYMDSPVLHNPWRNPSRMPLVDDSGFPIRNPTPRRHSGSSTYGATSVASRVRVHSSGAIAGTSRATVHASGNSSPYARRTSGSNSPSALRASENYSPSTRRASGNSTPPTRRSSENYSPYSSSTRRAPGKPTRYGSANTRKPYPAPSTSDAVRGPVSIYDSPSARMDITTAPVASIAAESPPSPQRPSSRNSFSDSIDGAIASNKDHVVIIPPLPEGSLQTLIQGGNGYSRTKNSTSSGK